MADKQTGLVLLIALSVTLFWLYQLYFFSWQISSDDAFNFVLAIERFSVLEFRPHFPGYPAFIGVIHLFNLLFETHLNALIGYTSFSSLSLVLLSAYLVYLLTLKPIFSLLLIVCVVLNPLLIGLALSGLSDAPALMLLLTALIFAYKQQAVMMGFAIALMLATRPSYLPLAFSFLLFLPLFKNKQQALLNSLLPILTIGFISFLFLISKDGFSYFSEGVRFTQGHFLIWGNTAVEQTVSPVIVWSAHIIEFMGWPGTIILICTVLISLFDKTYFIKALTIFTLLYLGYIFVAQNPDNIRHFAPVYYLFLVLFFILLSRIKHLFVSLLLVSLLLLPMLPFERQSQQYDPTNQAINYLQKQNSINSELATLLATNYSVFLITDKLKQFSVLDSYYPSSEVTIKNRGGWRLSGSPLEADYYQSVKTFYKRLPTERTLYLYRAIDTEKQIRL
ncbi:MAG: hypothetical protein GY787_32325 [Alteromonadales bacterium]|nr:hypothetical protein [Alteromonadales bacterium]